jgi:hypothetical protein
MANLTLRVPDELVARLQAEADRTKRSKNGMAEALFEEALSGLPELPEEAPSRKSASVRYGGWTIWWELSNPKFVKLTAPAPDPEQEGWWSNPFSGTPGNGRQGSEGLWLTLRSSDPQDKNNWNRCVHALEAAGQPAPPYVQLCTSTRAGLPSGTRRRGCARLLAGSWGPSTWTRRAARLGTAGGLVTPLPIGLSSTAQRCTQGFPSRGALGVCGDTARTE